MTYPAWETQFLNGIGAPLSATNYGALALWEQAEGGLPINNPMNISGTHPGSTSKCVAQCGSNSPIYGFDNLQDGTAATIAFISSGNNGYPAIIQAFQKDAGLKGIWTAINQSGWCPGCSGGTYPSTLYKAAGSPNPTGLFGQAEQAAEGAANSATGGLLGDAAGAASSSAQVLGDFGTIASDLSSKAWWLRVGEFAGGLALVIGGLVLFTSTTKTGETVIKAGGEAAGAAAVA